VTGADRRRYKPETKFNNPETFRKSGAVMNVGRLPDGRAASHRGRRCIGLLSMLGS
jgi:hypothetical protein